MESLEAQENRVVHPDSLLVIMDMQNGYINANTEHLLKDIEELLEENKFTHVTCTKFINQQSSPFVQLMNCDKMQTKEETDVSPEIMQYSETIFPHYGYSCWTPEFTKYVSNILPKIIYFVGLNTETSILMSAVECFNKKVQTEILADYCDSAEGLESHEVGLATLQRLVGEDRVIHLEDLTKVNFATIG